MRRHVLATTVEDHPAPGISNVTADLSSLIHMILGHGEALQPGGGRKVDNSKPHRAECTGLRIAGSAHHCLPPRSVCRRAFQLTRSASSQFAPRYRAQGVPRGSQAEEIGQGAQRATNGPPLNLLQCGRSSKNSFGRLTSTVRRTMPHRRHRLHWRAPAGSVQFSEDLCLSRRFSFGSLLRSVIENRLGATKGTNFRDMLMSAASMLCRRLSINPPILRRAATLANKQDDLPSDGASAPKCHDSSSICWRLRPMMCRPIRRAGRIRPFQCYVSISKQCAWTSECYIGAMK